MNVIVPLITTPYLSRTIGATGNGIFTYTQSIANYFVLFAQLGITNYGVREIASCGDNRDKRSETFWNLFAMNLVVGIAVTVARSEEHTSELQSTLHLHDLESLGNWISC